MRKLLRGIVEFRRTKLASYRETFARLALEQQPDALFLACSDSRVVPNLFASTDPGDLFVVRNPGNLVPACDASGHADGDESEAAAIEFAVQRLHVQDIVVCGHSECAAMHALLGGRQSVDLPHMRSWLRHADEALIRLRAAHAPESLPLHNHLSQLNVLLQLEHLRTHFAVRDALAARPVRLHGWYFDIARAEVQAYDPARARFVLLDEAEARRLLEQLGS